MIESEKDKLLSEETEFAIYCKKVRGYKCLPTGMWAVVLYKEFKEWQDGNINKVAHTNRTN